MGNKCCKPVHTHVPEKVNHSMVDLLKTPSGTAVGDMGKLVKQVPHGEVWRLYRKVDPTPLGKGVSCRVWHVERRADGAQFAMKVLSRSHKNSMRLSKREIAVLEELREHPNLLTLDCCLMDDEQLYMLTELCTGGQLFHRIKRAKRFSECEAAKVLAKVLATVQHLHAHDIVHRDLKLENIVYNHAGPDADIVIIDFGEARRIDNLAERMTDLRGTLPYLSPEQFAARAAGDLFKADVWAIGVIAHLLLVGRYPFWGATRPQTIHAIRHSRDTALFANSRGDHLSESARDFIASLLQYELADRPTCAEALEHPWIRGEAAKFQSHLGDAVFRSLALMQSASKLQQSVVDHLVRHMSEADAQVLDHAFDALDRNQDGVIDSSDVRDFYLERGSATPPSVGRLEVPRTVHETMGQERLLSPTDEAGGQTPDDDLPPLGSLDRAAFRHAKKAADMRQGTTLLNQFRRLDEDGDGFISIQDLKHALTGEQCTTELQAMVAEVDHDNDGKIGPHDYWKAFHLDSLAP